MTHGDFQVGHSVRKPVTLRKYFLRYGDDSDKIGEMCLQNLLQHLLA